MTIDQTVAEFTHLQARPNLIFARPGPRPATSGRGPSDALAPIRYSGAPGIALDVDVHLPLTRLPYPAVSSSRVEHALAALLLGAAGYQRYEPSNNYNAHRGYPSAQCKFPAEVFVCSDRGNWHYDPARHELRPVGSGSVGAPGPDVSLVVAARPGKLPEYYRELQWSLSLCEAGHLAEALLEVAVALGCTARLRTDFDDQAVLERLGARDDDAWLPAAIIELGAADLDVTRTTNPWEPLVEPVLSVDRLGWQIGSAPVDGVMPAIESGPPVGAAPEPSLTSSPSWADVLFERSSGRAVGGFAAAPESLPAATLSAVLSRLRTAAQGSWGGVDGSANAQRTLVIVERIDGVADGLYEWPLRDGPLRLVRAGRLLAEVQQAFFYPETVTRVDTCNFVLLSVLDYDRIVEHRGVRALRTSQLELGALAQAGGMAAAAKGAFLRPCRSFDADRLGALAGLAGGETVGYLCLGGTSRFTDLLLDLRP